MESDSSWIKIRAERELTERREEISRDFKKGNYSKEKLVDMLTENDSDTLDALCWVTKEGKIDVNEDYGKDIWRTAFDYFDYGKGANLSEETRLLEKQFYEVTVPERDQTMMKTWAEIKATLLKALTFGTILGYELIHKYRNAAYHRCVINTLYPEEKTPVPDVLRVE